MSREKLSPLEALTLENKKLKQKIQGLEVALKVANKTIESRNAHIAKLLIDKQGS